MAKNIIREALLGKKMLLPVLVALLGVVLLLLGGLGAFEEEKDASRETDLGTAPNAQVFAEQTEERIEALCGSVAGAGEVRAVVTLSGGYRARYATDLRGTDDSYQSQLVLTGSGSSEAAILVGYDNPEIEGIGIVCTGGDDPTVRAAILRLVSAAFGVGVHKIYVAAS